jgi:hypothetical protein
MDKALLTLGLSLVPFAWGFYLLFTYRSSKERILAYLAIAVSLLWIGMGTNFVIQVMKVRRIYRSNERPRVDPGWHVLFAFERPRPRAAQAGRSLT